MAKTQKKTGKGRLDKYYHLAKEQGYRSRAAFKLVQLNKKYNFLAKSKVLIDLCAAPGGWLQVAAKFMPTQSLIVGVDLVPIKSIAKVITFAEDISSDKCRAQLRQHLKTWKADTVLHDGAPNVGTAWLQDAYSQAVWVLMALKLATEFLIPGGTFVTKVFRSKDYNKLIWVFNQLFTKVEATKPPASRNVSAEIFVVCRGFKAPQKLDPKFLDPRSVFEELPDAAPNADARVFHPEKRKRQREGYEDGDYTFYKEEPAIEFVKSQDPIQMLSSTSRITWSDEESRKLRLKELTTKEIVACCEDLKVLGKKDFRNLLKWRLAIRSDLGLSAKPEKAEETPTETVTITEDDQIDVDMARMLAQDAASKKRERRKLNERKQKEITRMQLGMLTPHELGMEQDAMDEDEIFGLKQTQKNGVLSEVVAGAVPEINSEDEEMDFHEGDENEDDVDNLEAQLDNMYDKFKERKAEMNAKYRAKRAREDVEEWDGLAENGEKAEMSSTSDSDSDSDSEINEEVPQSKANGINGAIPSSERHSNGKLSRRAELFFDQPDFDDIDLDSEDDAMENEGSNVETAALQNDDAESESEGDFEVVPAKPAEPESWSEEDSDDEKVASQRQDIDIVTAEAMTLAHQLATRRKSKSSLIDDSYNRWTFADKSALPSWFADDESQHNTPQIPITAEAAQAIKDKLRALNARPIKKVAEAKARKKMKAVRKINKLQKKADIINETSDMSEREKAQSIAKVMAKGKKGEKKRSVKVVVAAGRNRGVSGRPRGVKGRYKMVDPRMKKEKRALKRAGRS